MAVVRIAQNAQRQFDTLPLSVKARIATVFDRLCKWPDVSGAKPLRGPLAGQFRVRTGDYRVQFRVDAHQRPVVLTITKVGHRDGFYED